MVWKKRKVSGKNKNYSIAKKLRNDLKSNEEFEVMLNMLTLEEVIALKFELASKVFGSKLYGMPIWYSTKEVVQDALLKYALSATKSKREAARFLGISPRELRNLLKKYKVENYFEK